jgi:hypothetical protein
MWPRLLDPRIAALVRRKALEAEPSAAANRASALRAPRRHMGLFPPRQQYVGTERERVRLEGRLPKRHGLL